MADTPGTDRPHRQARQRGGRRARPRPYDRTRSLKIPWDPELDRLARWVLAPLPVAGDPTRRRNTGWPVIGIRCRVRVHVRVRIRERIRVGEIGRREARYADADHDPRICEG